MAKYRCTICGYIYDEEREEAPFSGLRECPVCHQPADRFTLYADERGQEEQKEKKLNP